MVLGMNAEKKCWKELGDGILAIIPSHGDVILGTVGEEGVSYYGKQGLGVLLVSRMKLQNADHGELEFESYWCAYDDTVDRFAGRSYQPILSWGVIE